MGRGAVNQKGPQAAFLAALHAIRGAGQKLPVNLVLVAEGEEEIGSPHFRAGRRAARGRRPRSRAAWASSCRSAAQDPDGSVTVSLGAKGVVELELVASGEKWGRGPARTSTPRNRARLDSPAFHLVQALATLVTPEGDTRDRGLRRRGAADLGRGEGDDRPTAAKRLDEATAKKHARPSSAGPTTCAWREALERLRLAADRQHRGPRRPATRARAARPSCRTAPSPSSTCGSSPT